MGDIITSYRDLIVWQKAMDVVDLVYDLTETLPKTEIYRLVDQMQRSVTSIPSNIAEGSKRRSRKDYRHFLIVAQSSGAELETQLEIARRRNYGILERIAEAQSLLDEVMRMLHAIIDKL